MEHCPKCTAQVISGASHCPHCKKRLRKSRAGWIVAGLCLALAVALISLDLPGLVDSLSALLPASQSQQELTEAIRTNLERDIRREIQPSAFYGSYEISFPRLSHIECTVRLTYERGPMRSEEAQVISRALAMIAADEFRRQRVDLADVSIFARVYTRGAAGQLQSHGMASYRHETGTPVWLRD